MPDSHRLAMPQVTAVDELFGTHTPTPEKTSRLPRSGRRTRILPAQLGQF